MIIDIDSLPEEGVSVSKDYEFFSTDLIEENTVFLDPLHADVTVRRAGEELLIKGRITTRLSLICSRCLSPFEFRVDSRFDHVYLPEELEVERDQLDPVDVGRLYYHNRTLDLKEIILEQLNLTYPARPLCAEDCKGICPICGQIIKEGNCSCASGDADPRLEKLKTLLRDK